MRKLFSRFIKIYVSVFIVYIIISAIAVLFFQAVNDDSIIALIATLVWCGSVPGGCNVTLGIIISGTIAGLLISIPIFIVIEIIIFTRNKFNN